MGSVSVATVTCQFSVRARWLSDCPSRIHFEGSTQRVPPVSPSPPAKASRRAGARQRRRTGVG
eukprot:5461874-Alexandrium_andersonii.AAC.1